MIMKNESGRTMVEMMGVLAIMGVIMYGAIAGITFGVNMYKVTATYNDLEQAAENIKDLYSWQREGYGNQDLACELLKEGLDPLRERGGCVESGYQPFSSRWTGVEIHIYGGEYRHVSDGKHFIVKLEHLTQFACKRLANMSWSQLTVENGNSCNCDDKGDPCLLLISD